MRKSNIWRALAIPALLSVSCVGCGGNSNPTTYKVIGVVTVDGKPIDGATVSFTDVANGPHAAVSKTDSEGKYALTTFEAGDGAVPGTYKVSVTKYGKEEEAGPYNPAGDEEIIPEGDQDAFEAAYGADMAATQAKGWKPPKTWNDVNDKYASGESSGLVYTVTAEDDQVYDIALTK
jgi:hypothetical protein